jgi:hypothetical protein
MKTFLFWLFLLALIGIHSVDMELTRYYIGDQWENETFPLMRICIKEFGIYNSIWISRVCTYLFFYICYVHRQNDKVIFAMFLITVLYYMGMVPWLFTLGLVDWPLPPA